MTILKSLDINTVILLLILMMMFGQYSQKYLKKANWGENWQMEKIAPFVYYASGGFAIVLCLVLLARFILCVL